MLCGQGAVSAGSVARVGSARLALWHGLARLGWLCGTGWLGSAGSVARVGSARLALWHGLARLGSVQLSLERSSCERLLVVTQIC